MSNPPAGPRALIEAEVCQSFAPPLAAGEHRRNVVTRGIDLNALVGHEFAIGELRCRGMRLCEPCTVVDGYASRPVLRQLVQRGGLRADILEDGVIRVGDRVHARWAAVEGSAALHPRVDDRTGPMRDDAVMEVGGSGGDAALLVAGCAVAAVLGLLLSPRVAVPAATVVIAATQLAVRSPQALSALLGAVAFFLGASVVRRLRDDGRAARAALRHAQLDHEERARAAALAERSRMARELHDVLAHSLAALSVQLEAAHALLARPGGVAEARALVDAGRASVRDGLDDARRAVEALDGAHEMPGALHGLGARFERATGVPCAVSVEGRLRALPPGGDLALYRAAQEALTNALKHGAPTEVRMTLHQTPEIVELRVEHAIPARDESRAAPVGGQRGLRGLRERAEALGGALEAAPTSGGFALRMTIPNG